MKIIVRECRDCGRDMVTRNVYRSRVLPRDRYARAGAHGLCMNCYAQVRRHGADPTGPVPPRRHAPSISPGQPCRGCDRPLMHQRAYLNDIDRYKPLGYVSMGGHGMCVTCYHRASIGGTLPDPAPRRRAPRWSTVASPPAPLDAVELARLRAAVGLG